ncbi:MAG: HAMP domain-containing sensor histidine kinase [Pseudomonadota bacterium]
MSNSSAPLANQVAHPAAGPSPDKGPDKTIVERRVGHQNDQSRKAVKALRSGGGVKAESGIAFGFRHDVLAYHAQTQPAVMAVYAVLGITACAVGYKALAPGLAFIWFAVLFCVLAANVALSLRFRKQEPNNAALNKWNTIFVGLTAGIGLCWAALFAIYPLHTANGSFSVLAFAALSVLTVLALVSARYIKYGVLIAALPLTLAVCSRLAMNGSMGSFALMGLMALSLIFFQILANTIRESHMEFLNSRAERDQLIMELEASRSISDEARRRAEDANLAKSRFLATMSHELRTPLNAILGFSEVMSNEVMGPLSNDYYREYVGDIHRSGAHLLKLINEILDLSRVEAGRYELNEEAVNLAHAAEESQQMVKLKASEKNVNLSMHIQPNLPQIWADARSIRQVILNLLSNAIKFTPPGGTIWLKVGWTAGGGQYVSIRDTGPGIPEDEIPIVLSSFGQGSIAIKSAEQGTGLGLPIVQALVHMHDGKFELKSKLREGTEVIATFPRSRVMEVMEAMPVDGQRPAPRNGLRRAVTPPRMAG